jgi:hypothetical protein
LIYNEPFCEVLERDPVDQPENDTRLGNVTLRILDIEKRPEENIVRLEKSDQSEGHS